MDRRLATILALDAVGFSAMMGKDEERTLEILNRLRTVIDAQIESYSGRIFGSAGDSVIAEFSSPVAAVRCATELQPLLAKKNSEMPTEQQMQFRIGIHIGDIIVDGNNLMGDGVNVAARLEQMAPAEGVCISNTVADLVLDKIDPEFGFSGEHSLKNIAKDVGVWVWPEHHVEAITSRRRLRRSLGLVGVCAVLLASLLAVSLFLNFRSASVEELPSVAVMPFDDRSPGPDQGYLSDAISDGIISELAKFTTFRTVARNSSFAFRGKDADFDVIREALGVAYILEGSQQKIGEQLVVTAQLLDANSGTYIWTENFEGKVGQLFKFQSQIIRSVASTVGGKLATYPGLIGDRETVSALHLSAKALRFLRTGENEKARSFYEAAIEADPKSVIGYRGLGFYFRNVAISSESSAVREQAAIDAHRMANKALDLDPNSFLTHYLLGHLHLLNGDLTQAQARYDKTKELNPSFSNAFVSGASILIYTDEMETAISDIKHAMDIDPLHPQWFHTRLAWAYWANGDCDASKDAFLPMTRISPASQKTRAAVLACAGDLEDASKAMAIHLKKNPAASLTNERELIEDLWTSSVPLNRWLDDLQAAGMPE